MDADVQAFDDKLAEKAAAKAKALSAVGAGDWDTVAKYGINGVEGQCMAEAQAMADAYVAAHPEQFVAVQNEEDVEKVVKLIDLFNAAGMEEAALAMTMFELAHFERQEIGVATRAKVRLGNGA